ncbi:CheR family methyltransferase [Chitinimonas lacunae]|uniref:CheR family methyltransferase n=1 Tax=Chitinimonas lacunae TaxID=1963018 RepID=A0ABV8MJQ2_9NEIS
MNYSEQDFEIELQLLVEAIYRKYNYDFRNYSPVSLRRRVKLALSQLGCDTVSNLQGRIIHSASCFSNLLQYLTISVSEMFRDPEYFLALREQVVPLLHTYPSLKVWVAGCSTGEEVYSMAILLQEEGLLERTIVYATDINPHNLEKAEAGIYPIENMQRFTVNYQRAGGKQAFSDYYTAAYGAAILDQSLRRQVVFADHSLATDAVFAETQLISCRNVLIYFNRELQDRACGLFADSLCRKGFLGLGAKETVQFSSHAAAFTPFAPQEKIFRKN